MDKSENFLNKIEKIRSELLANNAERNRILNDLAQMQDKCSHLKTRRVHDIGWRERMRCDMCDKEW